MTLTRLWLDKNYSDTSLAQSESRL